MKKKKEQTLKKKSTPESRAKARENHWRKTGVSNSTINWMKGNNYL
jgi:hypothetical protein